MSRNLTGTIDLGQIKTIGKERIVSRKICTLTREMKDVDNKLFNIFGLSNVLRRKDNEIQSLKGKITYLQNKYKK